MIFSKKSAAAPVDIEQLKQYIHDTRSSLVIIDFNLGSTIKYLNSIEIENKNQQIEKLEDARSEAHKLNERLNDLASKLVDNKG